MLSPVRPSVTRVDQSCTSREGLEGPHPSSHPLFQAGEKMSQHECKTVEVRIMQFSPYSSSGPLVFAISKNHPEIPTGSPRAGASNNGGVQEFRETSHCRSFNAFARWLPMLDIL